MLSLGVGNGVPLIKCCHLEASQVPETEDGYLSSLYLNLDVWLPGDVNSRKIPKLGLDSPSME